MATSRFPFPKRSLVLLVWLFILAGLLLFMAEPVRLALRSWTGEEDLIEGLKGTAALIFLRLTQPPIGTAPLVPIAYTESNLYGVNTFLEQEVEEEKIRKSLAMIRDAGFHWIRQEFPWEDVEIHSKGDFEDRRTTPYKSAWQKYDRIVALAEEYGLEIIARLDQTPAWALGAEKPEGIIQAPPENLADFGDFVYAIVSRYRGRIRYWQIWNEPNLYVEWGEPPDPMAYTQMLKIAYQRAKEADPQAVIISAALAPTLEEGPQNISDLTYLEGMYQAAAQEYFDILAAQAFGLWTGPTDLRTDPSRTNFSRVLLLRQIMLKNGDQGKAIWITEFGWNVAPKEMSAPWGRVSLENQADYAKSAYLRAQREWPWVGVMNYWFFKRASNREKDQPFYYFRLVESDFTPMPVYQAISDLANSPPFLGIGFHPESHWVLTFEGEWRRVGEGQKEYRISQNPGDSLTFSFWGTDLYLATPGDENPGAIEVRVDGEPAKDIELSQHPSQIPLADGLAPGLHQVEIKTISNGVAILGLIVHSDQPSLWPLLSIPLGLILLFWFDRYLSRRAG